MADAQPEDVAIPALRAAGLWKDDDNSRSILKAVWTPALWKGGENAYELERNFRIERNHRFMAGLGLGGAGPKLANKRRPGPLAGAPRKRRAPSGPPRRSPRTKGEVSYSGERVDRSLEEEREGADEDYDYEDDDEDDEGRWERRVHRTRAEIEELDDSQRAVLADPNWITGFERWLKTGDEHTNPASQSNIDRCIPRVTELAKGQGINYHLWERATSKNTFYPGVKVDMTSDLFQIWFDGKAHEDRYGKDRGNGWKVNHPVKKLLLYQRYLWRQHLASGGAEDEAEDVEEDASVAAAASADGAAPTDEAAEEDAEVASIEAAKPAEAPVAVVTPRKQKATVTPTKRSARAASPRVLYDPKAEAEKPQWSGSGYMSGMQPVVVAPKPAPAPKSWPYGAKLSRKFPGCGVFTGEVVGADALLKGKYLVEWSDGDETSETAAFIKKHLTA